MNKRQHMPGYSIIIYICHRLKYMVTLDQEFRKRAGETIENYLRILSGTSPNRQNLIDTWKYEHEDDFMYGLVVGQLDGLMLGYFRGIYDRAPSDEES